MNREEINIEERDLLTSDFLDGKLTGQGLAKFNHLRRSDPTFDEEVIAMEQLHLSLREVPIMTLSKKAQQALETSIIPKSKAQIKISGYGLAALFTAAFALFIMAISQMEEIIPSTAVKLNPQIFNIKWNLFNTQWMSYIPTNNEWIYITFLLIIPIIYLMDQLINRKLNVRAFSFI